MEYLAELLREKDNLAAFPNYFYHTERLLDIEIARVRNQLFSCNIQDDVQKLPIPVEPLEMPGMETITLTEKIYIPIKEHPNFNFVGRILGPRGMTAKQLERDTGCKIMIRGKGSLRDEANVYEETHRGKQNWEHLEDDLHVLVQCEDIKDRAKAKLDNAVSQVKRLLIPPGGIDELKRKQLLELSIMNGTFRSNIKTKFQQRTIPSLSLVPPTNQPLLSPPIYHSAFAPQTTFFNSPLPSPVMSNFKPSPPSMVQQQRSYAGATSTNKSVFEFKNFYSPLNNISSGLDQSHTPLAHQLSYPYGAGVSQGQISHALLRKTKSGPGTEYKYNRPPIPPSEGRPIQGMPITTD